MRLVRRRRKRFSRRAATAIWSGPVNPLRRYPMFAVVILSSALIVVGEAAWTVSIVRGHRSANSKLLRARKELRALSKTEPSPTITAASELELGLSRQQIEVEKLKLELVGAASSVANPVGRDAPLERADGFFDIAAFVERMHDTATRRGVRLNADERFGFAAYAHAGPEIDALAAIFRQRCAIEYLLQILFDARPQALLAVQRERESIKAAAQTASEPLRRDGSNGDSFEWDSRLSSRIAETVDAFAMRISFVAETVTLRALLNRLDAFEVPLVVREVEVEPAAKVERGQDRAAVNQVEPAPLVAKMLSRFTVTVEWVGTANAPDAHQGT